MKSKTWKSTYKVDKNSPKIVQQTKSPVVIFEYDEYKREPIFDFNWKYDKWVFVTVVICAVIVTLTI